MTVPHDLQRLAATASVSILVTVMVGSGGLTVLSHTDWWCRARAQPEVEALRAVTRTHFPDGDLQRRTDVTCDDEVRASVRTDLPTSTTATATHRLLNAGWTLADGHLHSPDGRWEASVTADTTDAGTGTRVRLWTLSD